jgi:hypothetical protein
VEVSTVFAGTPKRLFESSGASANTIGRIVVWVHNTGTSGDLWYRKVAAGAAIPSIDVASKMGRILPGETVPIGIEESIDLVLASSSGTIAYTAWEEA